MAEYKLTNFNSIIRVADKAWIPKDEANRDYAEYLKWLADGGVPDPPDQIEEATSDGA